MLYSIVIPHKNSADLLERLLNSIPVRQDLEVIVVDDHSSEQEMEKLSILSHQYPFFLYQNLQGMGAGSSRNVGLDNAKGEFVIFADSDDFFDDNLTLELEKIPDYGKDIIFYKVNSVDSMSYQNGHRHEFFNGLVDTYKSKNCNDILYKYSVPWGKVFRRSFLKENNIRFAEVVAGNDMWFSCLAGVLCKSYAVYETIIYTVTVREGSIVNTIKPEYFLSRFNETLRVNEMLRKNKLGHYQYSVLYFISNANKFGLKAYVAKEILKHRSNVLIGLEKIFQYKKVMIDRENRRK